MSSTAFKRGPEVHIVSLSFVLQCEVGRHRYCLLYCFAGLRHSHQNLGPACLTSRNEVLIESDLRGPHSWQTSGWSDHGGMHVAAMHAGLNEDR